MVNKTSLVIKFYILIKENYHVDKTNSYWNAFRLRSYHVCNEQV